MLRLERSSQETTVPLWERVLIPPQGIKIKNIFKLFCWPKTLNKWKMLIFCFRKKATRLLNTNFENNARLILPCLLLWPHFLLPNYKTTSQFLPKWGRVFRALACCNPPLPGKALKLFFLLHAKICLCISILHQWAEANFWQWEGSDR